MDYADLQAFGVGIKIDDFDYNKLECDINDINIMQGCSKLGFLNDKLLKVKYRLSNVVNQLCVMALRYDERVDQIFNQDSSDDFQNEMALKKFSP